MPILSALLLVACGGGGDGALPDAGAGAPDADLCNSAAAQAALDEEREAQGIPGAVVLMRRLDLGCSVHLTSGVSNRETDTPVERDHKFRIASISKTFTAVVIHQLAEEGLLSLDDSLETWYPGFPNGENITIRHLLGHTSGIFDFVLDPAVLEMGAEFTPDELIQIGAEHEPDFPPGTSWSYSSTGYTLLGRIIENATESSYLAEVRARLLDPLGLGDTFLKGWEEVPGVTARGYGHQLGTYYDVTDWHTDDFAWAEGGMVSTAADLTAWFDALLFGDVLTPASLALMTTPQTVPDGTPATGLGLFVRDSSIGTMIEHSGALTGYISLVAWFPEVDLTAAIVTNDSAADPYLIVRVVRTAMGIEKP